MRGTAVARRCRSGTGLCRLLSGWAEFRTAAMSASNSSSFCGKSRSSAAAIDLDGTSMPSEGRAATLACTVMGGCEKTSGAASSAATSSPYGAVLPRNVQFSRRSAPERSTKMAPPELNPVLSMNEQLLKAAAVGRSSVRARVAWIDHAAPVAERNPVKRQPACCAAV